MELTVNGVGRRVSAAITLADLVSEMIPESRGVAVAVRTWKSSCPVKATGSQVAPASMLRTMPRLCSPSSVGVAGPGCPDA